MGGSNSVQYAIPISEKPKGESAVYRFPQFKDGLLPCPHKSLSTMKHILINSSKQYANRPALGQIIKKENQSDIQYITYRELIEKAAQVGSGINHSKLYSQPEGQALRFVGIFSKNRPEWTTVDVACLLFNFTTVPIYDTLGDENITYVFKHTQLTTCFVSDSGIKALIKTHDLHKISSLVCFDPFTQQQKQYFAQKNVKLISFEELLFQGKANLKDYNDAEFRVEPNTCLTFSYTSGTTGPPKGAMISHQNFTSFMAACATNKDTAFNSDDVALSYLPLPHILEREFLYSMLHVGARIVYFSGDVQKIKDDLALVKPTIFVSVPRLFSRFHDVLRSKFNQLQGWTKKGLDYALSVKLQNLQSSGSYTHRVYDRVFFNKTRQALGGNVRLMISGSAPLLPDVQNFLKVCMCAPLCEGYGQTESTGAAFITDSRDPEVRHVGGPTSNFEFKLVDIPQMNYLSTDVDQQGRSTPRGQIWLKGPGVFLGYYHDEAKTKEAITQDGWLKTGDVGALHPITRGIKIVDRKKNIFKLQQGEYVAAEKVENIYLKCSKLAEIFIHGESTESFVIAIVVPHRKAVLELAETKKIQGTFEELCKNESIRAQFVVDLNKIGKEEGLQGFEQVKNLYLQNQTFLEKGIVTNTMKIQRHEAKKCYKDIVTQLYKEGMLKTDKK